MGCHIILTQSFLCCTSTLTSSMLTFPSNQEIYEIHKTADQGKHNNAIFKEYHFKILCSWWAIWGMGKMLSLKIQEAL